VSGSGRIQLGSSAPIEFGAGDIASARYDRNDWFDFSGAGNRVLIYVSDDTINDLVTRYFHIVPSAPLDFRTSVKDSDALTGIRHTTEAFTLASAGLGDGAIRTALTRQYADILILAVLAKVPSSISDLLVAAASPATSRHVHWALEFMHGNLEEHIGLIDIASAAGCSPRRLQTGFQAQLGLSPMAKLRSLRLAAAETRLRSGECRSVTDVALSLCFPNPGAFAGEFHRLFGVHPSILLRAHKLQAAPDVQSQEPESRPTASNSDNRSRFLGDMH
jgi:AraC-like DNA-binding protein